MYVVLIIMKSWKICSFLKDILYTNPIKAMKRICRLLFLNLLTASWFFFIIFFLWHLTYAFIFSTQFRRRVDLLNLKRMVFINLNFMSHCTIKISSRLLCRMITPRLEKKYRYFDQINQIWSLNRKSIIDKAYKYVLLKLKFCTNRYEHF